MDFVVSESKFRFLEIKLEDQETKVFKFFEFWKMVVLLSILLINISITFHN